ncbi:MAG TPA: exosortase B [Methylophilaceae bacterium]|nr:exosortase B [Methylophilaceae bacterium]
MATLSSSLAGKQGSQVSPWTSWIPVAIGLAAICLPTFYHLSQTAWNTDENGHGPIILAVFCWLMWQKRHVLIDATYVTETSPVLGWSGLIFGLLVFIIGSSQGIATLEVGAFLPILIGILLLMRGWSAVRALWFPLLFLCFMVPLPGVLVDAITGPLKQQVSAVAENVLYLAGYPIARTGVMLSIGQYQLLVADACSGLHSMFSLTALGLLYIYIMDYRNWLHIGLLLAVILPIAFLANVIRVMILVLITYYFGDAAGQGFAHSATGMVLFVLALFMLFAFDSLLRFMLFRKKGAAA